MKRNWDTIREILIAIENLEPEKQLALSDYNEVQAYEISHHISLLEEAGLIKATISQSFSSGPKDFFVFRLTWQGNELLEAIQNDTIWNKTKDKFQKVGGAMTFDLVKSTASVLIKSALENS